MLTILVYGSFGLSRLVGLVLDGITSNSLAIATVIELVIAGIGVMMLRTITPLPSSPRGLNLRVSTATLLLP